MLNFTYTTPKEENTGRKENELVEKTAKHTFKDTNRDIINDELSKLMARYPDYDFNLTLSMKKSKSKK